DQVPDGAGLVGQVGGDERPLRRIGDGAEHIVAPRGLDDDAVFILLPPLELTAVVAHGDPRRGPPAFGDEHEVHAIVRDSASSEREMSTATTRFRPRVSATIRSSPQRGPESATVPRKAATESAVGTKRPEARAVRSVSTDQRRARRMRTRRAHAAANHTAPPITGAHSRTNGASKVIAPRARRAWRTARPRGPAPGGRAPAAGDR